MIVVDAYAVLAFLKGERAARRVEAILEGDEDVRLTAVGVAEVLDHLVRVAGSDSEDAALDLAQLGLAEALPLDAAAGIRVGLLRARHYHRRNRALSLADCVAADATAFHRARLATSDPHLLDLCRMEGIDVVVLPESPPVRSTSERPRPTA